MRMFLSVIIGSIALCLSMTALSHHSFSAEFDVGRPIDITGTVTEIEWTNPHAWLHIATEDEQGNVQHWAIELLGINALIRSGMSPSTVKAGEELTVTGFGSRDGTNTANASSVTRTDTGESLWASARERNN